MSHDTQHPAAPGLDTALAPIRLPATKREFVEGYKRGREREQALLGHIRQLQVELDKARQQQSEAWGTASSVASKIIEQVVRHTGWEHTGFEHHQLNDGTISITLRFSGWVLTVNAARGLLTIALPGKLDSHTAEIDNDGLTDKGLLTFLGYLTLSKMPAETRRTLPTKLVAKLCTQAAPPAAPRIVARSRQDD